MHQVIHQDQVVQEVQEGLVRLSGHLGQPIQLILVNQPHLFHHLFQAYLFRKNMVQIVGIFLFSLFTNLYKNCAIPGGPV